MQLAVGEGVADVHVAMGHLKRTRAKRPFDAPREATPGLSGRALVGALMSINPDRVKRGSASANR